MATSFLSSTQIASLTGVFSKSFETFTMDRSRTVTIFKEPIKTISSVNSNIFPGYGPSSNMTNITYTPVSGVYPAVITYIAEQNTQELATTKTLTPQKAKVRIRVEQDCANFIENGSKVEKVLVNGDSYNVNSEREVNSFLSLNYYVYYLEKTT